MGRSSAPKHKTSNISPAANPSAASSTTSKSSVLKSSFCPSHFQLALFASVIQGLGSEHLRIHETNTGRLRCDYKSEGKGSITCLDWGFYRHNTHDKQYGEATKKRKRTEQPNSVANGFGADSVVLALGASNSEISLFSPQEAKVVAVLKDGHTQGIRDFKFAEGHGAGQGWSIGGDSKLVQWELRTGRPIKTINLTHGPASAIQPAGSSVICASHLAYILDPDSKSAPPTFSASTNPVRFIVNRSVQPSEEHAFLTAADNDHSISVFEETSTTMIGSLRTENEILHIDASYGLQKTGSPQEENHSHSQYPQNAIAAVNKDGTLEIFMNPFQFGVPGSQTEIESLKARLKQRTRKSDAHIKLMRADKRSSPVHMINASFRDDDIVMAYVEGGVNVIFDTLSWRDGTTGRLLLIGYQEIVRRKSSSGVSGIELNGVKDMGKTQVDESHAVVANGVSRDEVSPDIEQPEVIDISSAEDESESSEDNEDPGPPQTALSNATRASPDIEMEDAPRDEVFEDKDEPSGAEEPSFGERLRANAPDAVDVQASFPDPHAQSLVPTTERSVQTLPQGMSLGTVLTQSLRTNDKDLLESCFLNKDLSIIRATIERLDSSLAPKLLERLAERLHSRPGRAGSLMVWIQWTLVAHGGYLASNPEVIKKLASLHRVVKQRANSLQSLLSLKGKLDMLEAQMNLRKRMHARSRLRDEDDEEAVVYVEGQDEADSDEESEDDNGPENANGNVLHEQQVGPGAQRNDSANIDMEDADSGNEMPMANGNIADSEDEASDSEEEGMFDEEASSTERDSGDELLDEDMDHDDADTDSSDAEASPQPKKPTTSITTARNR